MTNPTPHGQEPEVLIDLIDAYADRCGSIYNAKTEAARNAVIEALSGVQALSAAPAVPAGWKAVPVNPTPEMWKAAKSVPDPNPPYPPHYGLVWDAMLAASPTPPAEQQAPKETLGGVNGWRDISTAPKDGSRFVATGHNYWLYSEVRHTCVAQWFRGCWMEASDWNETSELKYLTHWMPLPSPPDDVAAPAEQQAAPKAAPGEQDDHQILAITTAYEQGVGKGHQAYNSGKEIANPYDSAYRCDLAWQYGYKEGKEQAQREAKAAPQQEAQEPSRAAKTWCSYVAGMIGCYLNEPDESTNVQAIAGIIERRLWALPTPQPAPAPLSEMPDEKRKAIQEGEQISASDAWFHARFNMLDTLDRRNVFRAGFDRGWNAAYDAQGGK